MALLPPCPLCGDFVFFIGDGHLICAGEGCEFDQFDEMMAARMSRLYPVED